MSNIVARISEYENGELCDEEVIELFQELLSTRVVWSLQGHYGRMAFHLLEEGLISENR